MTPCLVWVGREHCYQRCHHLHPVSSLKVFHLFCCCFYCLLFTLYLLALDNTSVTVHAVSPSSRQRSCSSLFQMMQWYVLTPDNTSVTVHVVSPCSRQHISYCSHCISLFRQHISYCSRCISLFQTTHQLLFTLHLLVPNNTSVTVHIVSPCSKQHISYCSSCISLFQTTHQLLFTLYLFVPNNTSVTVQVASPCSKQHISYCLRCISLFQTTHQLLFTLYLLVPNNTSVTVHAVSSCSRRHSSCCSHCISWPVSPGCRTKPMKRCGQSHQSIQPHSLHTTSTA